jgi:hypothetical protein
VNLARDISTKRFWRGFTVHSLSALGVIAALIGIWVAFDPDTLEKMKFPETLWPVAVALVYACARSYPYPIEQQYSTSNTTVRLVTGDLFDRPTSLVIGMADTFDTLPPNIIAAGSVQGQFLDRVYSGDVSALDAALSDALADVTPIGTLAKVGKTDTYPIGTVATIRPTGRKQYFCLAYTQMDVNTNVHCTIGFLWEALTAIWDEVREKSNGEPVAIPVIGLGQSGMSHVLPIQDSIRIIILSFMFASRQRRVCERLDVVLRPIDEKKVDMLEIQAFLKSLRRS